MVKSDVARRLTRALLSSASIGAFVVSGVCFAGAANAQSGPSEPTPTPTQEIVVTGSRIGTPGFETPTPVTEITPQQLEVKQLVSVVDLFADIPSLTPNQAQSNVVDVGLSTFELRNLGPTRTLVLVNGLRTEFTSVNGGFDVNTLPTSLIKHVDIVTGGASAAYGSDAVAGVVNITLDTQLNGLKANVGGGLSSYGDDGTRTASIAWGSEFAGGRGHIVLGGEYFEQAGVQPQDSRPWGASQMGIVANPKCTTITTTCTELYIVRGVVPSEMTDGGVIVSAKTATGATSTALNNIQFGPGGVPQPFTVGGLAGSTYMIGGSGSTAQETMGLQAQIERENALMHAEYDITDNLNVWSQFVYARTSSYYPIVPNFSSGNITVTSANPFIPASILATMQANNITSLTMGRSNVDLAPVDYGRDLARGGDQDFDSALGIKDKFDVFGQTWSWDTSVQFDHNLYSNSIGQNEITQNYTYAIDSVANPAVNGVPGVAPGVPVCRSTLTNHTNGCVPLDVFGTNTVTPAVTAYVMGTAWDHAVLDMYDFEMNFKGAPFSTWAGPEAVAFGGEWRRQSTTSTDDPISAVGGFRNGNQSPYSGAYSVGEAYFEMDTPLAKDLPFAKSLDIDAAVRGTDYSNSGYVTTWKFGGNYSPDDNWRFRLTRSHDIRAPDLTELYQTGSLRNGGNVTNPSTGAQSIINTLTTGNPSLLPEIGDTITTGVVYTPTWARGFNTSFDYWHIRLTGAIAQQSTQQIINNCFAGQSQYCAAIQFSPTNGLIDQVESTQFNSQLLDTSGFDFEMAYRFKLNDVVPGWGGDLKLHMLGTYLLHYVTSGLGVSTDEAGCVGNCNLPSLRFTLNGIYIKDPWLVSLTGDYIGGGVIDQLYSGKYTTAQGGKTINDNNVSPRFYVNASVSYQLTDAWQVYGRVNNLFNISPPILPDTLGFQHELSGGLYDRIGTQFLVGFKLRLD